MMKPMKKQLGIGLIEILLALAVSALIVVVAVRYYQTASMNQRISATVNMVRDIYSAVQDAAKQPDFTLGGGDMMSDLISDGLLTQQYATNPFYGATQVTTSQPSGGGVPFLIITMEKLSDSACQQIAARLQQTMSNPPKVCGKSDPECASCFGVPGKPTMLSVHYELY